MATLTIFMRGRHSIHKAIQVMLGALGGYQSAIFIAFRIGGAVDLLITAASIADNSATVIIAAANFTIFFRRQDGEFTLIRLEIGRFGCITAAQEYQFAFGGYRYVAPPACSTPPAGSEF